MENLSQDNQIVTFGCRLNIYESEVIKAKLEESELKNVIVFNTCAVTGEAVRQARQAIRRARKENPDKKIIVTGCAAQTEAETFSSMAEVDFILGNEEKLKKESFSLSPESEKIQVNDIMSVKETASHMVKSFDGRSRAFLQIQNGCNHRCTFCIIPFGRGNSRSVAFGEIVENTKQILAEGYNEIVLTGVDITDYGLDFPAPMKLGQMMKRLLKLVPDLKRLRLSSIDVAEIDEELFDLLAYEKRIMPHIHISLQAGDNMILKRMKRRHNREQIVEFCHKIKALRPEIGFGADIIAGFPTEDEEMHKNTLNLVSETGLCYLHVFPYSSRKGTPAARMPQVKGDIRKERARLLREAGNQELAKFSKENIGRLAEAIVENGNIARLDNFLEVNFDGNQIAGSIVSIRPTEYKNDKLFGVIEA